MGEVRTIQINESIFAENDRQSAQIRRQMTEQGTLFLNFMSSPGSGKTTTLISLINRLKDRLTIAEMDVDITSTLDAQRVADRTGVRSLQIHNGGLCHIDADMTARALAEFDTKDVDLLILENITILSVPEGDDKPLKYPLMYQVSNVVLINKIDTLEYFDFSIEKAIERVHALNPAALIFPISAKTGEGMDALCAWVMREVEKVKSSP